jgi:hypothetical protein
MNARINQEDSAVPRTKIRVRKEAAPSKTQIYFSKEQSVKRVESSFLLDWVAGCEVLPVRSVGASSEYEQVLSAMIRRR